MNEEFLSQMRKSPRSEFTNELYQRINKPMPKQSAFNITLFRRTALVFGALAMILTLTLLLSPSVRAFAGEQIRQFGAIFLGPADSSEAEGNAAAPQPTIAAPPEITAEFANSAAEASALAGFTVLTPGYLPEGYAENRPWSVDNRDGSIYVVSSYGRYEGRRFLLLNQTKFAEDAVFEQQYGENETVTDVMVGQHPGVFISGRLMAHPDLGVRVQQERPDLIPTNWLIWEANGITYTLFGDNIDQSQLIRIAESLSG